MPRITARDGNVIAADFGARPLPPTSDQQLALTFKTAILFCDQAACLMRISYFMNGALIGIQHVTVEADHV
jgi:hypothetical protein